MKIGSISIVIIVLVVLGGGILAANLLNLWGSKPALVNPTSPTGTSAMDNSTPVASAASSSNTLYKPADISGTNTFAEISQMFNVPLDDLGAAFAITSEPNWQSLKARELKAIYTNLPPNIKLETESVRTFIALYTGTAYTYSDSSYLPKPGADILKRKATLTQQQMAFVDSHTYSPGTATSTSSSTASKHTVTGETSFGTLVGWGVKPGEIEGVIGDKMPGATVLIRDYAGQKGKDFLSIVSALQELANRY
jgi:hypothetical protein